MGPHSSFAVEVLNRSELTMQSLLGPDFASDALSPSSVWLPKPMSGSKSMRTLRSFLELNSVTRKVA